MKKILALLAAAAILLTLGGCSLKKEKTALVISGTDIGMEIYNYYYDLVEGRPADYGLSVSPKEKDIKEVAIALCKRYIALNSSFVVHKLSLSATDKINISDKVNNHWMRFENHYDKIGVSKQTLYKIFTSETYEDVIFSAIYDKGVNDKAQEKKIKQYFYSEYVAFRSVCVYFTGSDGRQEMTEAEKQQVMTDMNDIARETDETAESFISTCSAKGYTASDVVVIKRDSDGYPGGFFDSIYDQTDNSVKIIAYGDCVFAVQKANLEALGEGLYAGYRSVLIKDMYAEEWQNTLNSYIDTFTVDEKNV